MKICLECAEGGHFEEMMSIMEAFKGHEIVLATASTQATKNLPFKTYYAYRPNKFLMNSGYFGQIISILINSLIAFKIIAKRKTQFNH